MVAGINRVPTGGSDSPSARVQVANSVNAALAAIAKAQSDITANAAAAVGGDLTGTLPSPTIGTNKVTNAKLAQMAANTVKGNNTAGTANAADLTADQTKALLGGTLAQAPVIFETGTVATGTGTFSNTNTIPTTSNGDQYMSATITPKNASSTLVIDVVWIGTNSTGNTEFVGLYQDATVNALAAAEAAVPAAGSVVVISFRHKKVAGTTSATTFKVRAGDGAAGTTTFNGTAGGQLLGGVMASSITITEILP